MRLALVLFLMGGCMTWLAQPPFLIKLFAKVANDVLANPPWPEEYILSDAQTEAVLPPKRTELFATLASIPWRESDLPHDESLLITSGQSLSATGARVKNRIYFFPRGRYDIWLMKQTSTEHALAETHWNRVVIAVDRQSRPPRATYLELGRENGPEPTLPPLRAFSASCLSCHPSGPRLIRPERTGHTPDLDEAGRQRLRTWNERIYSYRHVENDRPLWEGQSMGEWNRPGDHEPLRIKACIECHNPDSDARAGLERQNADSIWYLVRHQTHEDGFMQPNYDSLEIREASMPQEAHALSKKELLCLKAWLDHPTKSNPPGCKNGEPREARAHGAHRKQLFRAK